MDTKIKDFYDLEAWKKGHQLTISVYEVSKTFPKDEQFGVISQLRRAVSSIPANIAEGFDRYHFKDKVRFYYQARGSVAEVQNFLILSRDLCYLDQDTCSRLCQDASEVRMLINGLIRSIERQK